MKTGFFDVFKNLNVDNDTHNLFQDVSVSRIVSNKDKSLLRIHVDCVHPIPIDVVYSVECQIRTQIFPGEKINVKFLGVPEVISYDENLPSQDASSWDNDFAMADSIIENDEPKKTEKKSPEKKAPEKKAKKEKKDYGENVIYGRPIKADLPITSICDLDPDMKNAVIIGEIFKTDQKVLRNEKVLVFLFITDDTDSISAKLFLEPDDADELLSAIKKNKFVKIKSSVGIDKFDNEQTLMSINGIEVASDFRTIRMDNAIEKRVELHAHTVMSDMDGIIAPKALINRAKLWGHKGVAITDHGCVQAFPDAAKNSSDDFKIIYGMEGYICDDTKPIANILEKDYEYLLDQEFIVFDLETTGLNASKEDIIEIGAVKVKNKNVIDTFSAFVNIGRPLSYEIITLTGIEDAMLKDAPEISEVFPKFKEFCEDLPLVAHNADFDISVVKATANRLGIRWEMSYLDTVPIARVMLPSLYKTKLDNVAKALGVILENHHRAVDDAMCTAHIFNKFVDMLENIDIKNLKGLNTLDTKDSSYVKKLFPAHATILVKNDIGRINLYRLVSMSHLKSFRMVPRIPKSELIKHREGLIIGSGCSNGELFDALKSGKNEDELARIVSFYDFLEVMPPENNSLLWENGKYGIKDIGDIKRLNAKIVELGEKYGKPVVATSDAHYIDPEDEIYRRIILSEKKISQKKVESTLYYRTTDEMLEAFEYLGEKKAYEIVVKNSNLICDMIDRIKPTRPDKAPPVIENSDVTLREICYRKAHEMYGEKLPEILEERLERELNSIISNGYALMYIIAQKLVWKSNEDGYIVGSRGSVGSSLVATMAGISEVNPLPPHYLCDKCYFVDFDSDEVKSQANKAGCDMPDRICPNCGAPLGKHGFDIPFETFLGFKGNKEPDIDLNFSGEYLNKAHKYTEVIFGEGQTFRAGTVGTIKENTAYAYAKSYYNKKEEYKKKCDIERISLGCMGVRRSTGQHPGGIIVLPVGEEMESFTPVQHPANDMETDIVTTHFDFHSIDSNLLKLDILGKDDPTQIRLLQDITGIGVDDIPLDDRKVMSLFQETSALGLTPSDLNGCDFGTLGIPEFGTDFAMGILRDTQPQGIMDLVRIAGLSHGTDVWNGNAKELIADGKATIGTAICTRDDIMLYLIDMGLPSEESFKIMESVRKGKGLTPEWKELMIEHNVPDWYIWSCETIKYMFPKAHAAAYVMMAYRLGYYKVYYPLAFYAAYFSIKATAFNYEMMCQGPEILMHYMEEYSKIQNPSAKEKDAMRDMRIVHEMYMRGFSFVPIDIYKSDAVYFKPANETCLLPPFSSIEGMGTTAAQTLAIAASQAKFTSKDDIRDRGKLTKTVLETMDNLGILKGFSQSNQLSFFD